MRFLNSLIPSGLKKLDRYLLLHYPQIWITKLHYILLFVLIFDVILYSSTFFLYQVNLKEYYYWRDYESPILIMILPAIALFVGWFVIQSWYNVDKNFGKLSIKQDYMNFLIYWLIAISIYSTVVVIPHAMHDKVASQLNMDELSKEYDIAVKFRSYQDYYHQVEFINGSYKVERVKSVDWDNIEDYDRYYYPDYDTRVVRTEMLSEEEVLAELEQYKQISDKYTNYYYNDEKLLDPDRFIDDIRLQGYTEFSAYQVEDQIWQLYMLKLNRIGFPIWNDEYIKILFAITGILALMTWIFKNVHWKNFIASLIIHILTPFIIGIFGIIFYLFNIRDAEPIALFLMIVATLTSIILAITPWLKQKHNSVGIISAITLQTWLPFLPFFYYLIYLELVDHEYWYYEYRWQYLEYTYYVGLGLSLISLPLFKTYYQRMWALPKKK